MKAGSIPAGGFPAATPEEELKTLVGRAFFRRWEWGRILGKIDFCVGMPARHAGDEFVSLLWAEAKRGKADLREALVQLVLTIGRARTFDRHLPPPLLAAFNAQEIAFVPYSVIQPVFAQSDFNWRVAPSDHASKEFQQLDALIGGVLEREATTFHFARDERGLREFIWRNLGGYAGGVARIEIDKNNFIAIYNRWLEAVKPTIGVDWDEMRAVGVIDGDFYLADVLSEENRSLKDKLSVLLEHDKYRLNRGIDSPSRKRLFVDVEFTDGQAAHTRFWNRYVRPPLREYWDFLVARRDLLVPQDIRERKGSFFTPRQWVELSQRYLAEVLGEDWQEEYTVWDPAAGTGNLLNGLTNKYNIWASTLDQQDVDVMRDRIRNGANLLESHVFQFDFLNDGFEKLPAELRAIVDDPERRKKLVVYMNPPYAETGRKVFGDPNRINKRGVSFTKVREDYAKRIGIATKELSAQFPIRVYCEIPSCILAEFSTLKILQGSNFSKFRDLFQPHLEKMFLVPANTFDNVVGAFGIGFKIWNCNKRSPFHGCTADLYDRDGQFIREKTIYPTDPERTINQWIISTRDRKNETIIGYQSSGRNDFQHTEYVYIVNRKDNLPNARGLWISDRNLMEISIYLSVQHCLPRRWDNDRDQFYWPKESWRTDTEFQADCLAYTLLTPRLCISCAEGINHWIPYTEYEVDAKEKFSSHFMTDFLAGKLGRKEGETGDLFSESIGLIPKEPVVFSPEAQAVLDAGRDLWRYYHAQPNANPNAALYDIRLHFQGCKPNGHMNPKSDDARYTELIGTLRERLKALARKIESKVYEHGFLLG